MHQLINKEKHNMQYDAEAHWCSSWWVSFSTQGKGSRPGLVTVLFPWTVNFETTMLLSTEVYKLVLEKYCLGGEEYRDLVMS